MKFKQLERFMQFKHFVQFNKNHECHPPQAFHASHPPHTFNVSLPPLAFHARNAINVLIFSNTMNTLHEV